MQRQAAALAHDIDGQVKPRPHAELFQRARIERAGVGAQRHGKAGAGQQLLGRQGAGDQAGHLRSVATTQARALQHARQAVVFAERGSQRNARAFGRGSQVDDPRGGGKVAAIAGTLGQRADALRGKFLRHAIIQRLKRGSLERGETGPQRQRGRGQRGASGRPMQPAAAADILRQIMHMQPARGGALDAQTRRQPAAGQRMGRMAPIGRVGGCSNRRKRQGRGDDRRAARAKPAGHGAARKAAAAQAGGADAFAKAAETVAWAVHARVIPLLRPMRANPCLLPAAPGLTPRKVAARGLRTSAEHSNLRRRTGNYSNVGNCPCGWP